MMSALERIGRRAAEEQDGDAPVLDEERGLARFREVVDAGVVRPKPARRWLMASAVLVLTVVVLAIGWPRSSVTFAVTGGPDVAVAEWIDSRSPTTLAFSDGTRVSATVGSRLRVSTTTPAGAALQLERGTLTADVISRESSKWLVDAGPFSIRVTGTRFSTSWDPVAEVFELRMHEGSVVLSGPIVGGQREVRAPEHLRIEVGRQKLSVVGPAPTATAAPTEAPAPVASAAPSTTAAAATAPSADPAATKKASAWAELARAGKYAEALTLVQELNAASLLASESAGGLMLLAQTARLGGDQALAARALESLSKRFPDSVQAKTAQFLSGKLSFDRGHYERAITALSAYLSSAPGGAFAGEANVLLILALHRAGRVAEAQALAGPYLERHPDGPHAARIRSIVTP